MKQILFILAMAAFLFVADSPAQTGGDEAVIKSFERYDGSYFEKSDSGLKSEPSYLVLTEQKQFDKIFGAATRMKNNKFLPPDAFDSKIIVATIKRGSLRKYDVKRITEENGSLLVWYTTEDKPPGSATFKSALIVAVDGGGYEEVIFMENGKKAGAVRLDN